MPFASLGRPRIYYEIRGPRGAPPLVLLRGLGRSLLHWDGALADLESRFRLVLLDNRGIGKSEGSTAPYGTGDMARDVVRVLDHAGIGRAHVFGMSLGGMVAQRLAIDHRRRVDRLVLGCTTPGGPQARRPRLGPFWKLARARLGGVEQAVQAEARATLSAAFVARHPQVLSRWRQIALSYPVSRGALARQLWAAVRHDSAAELDRITAPTLVLSSDSDALISPENSRLLARRITGAELAWLKGAGHDFATEQPVQTARLLIGFLND